MGLALAHGADQLLQGDYDGARDTFALAALGGALGAASARMPMAPESVARPWQVSSAERAAAFPSVAGTNATGQLTSRGSWRRDTLSDAWDSAPVGPTGGRLCITCGTEVSVAPGTGVLRDWHGSHYPSWTNRYFPADFTRRQVLDNYQRGVRVECPSCNMRGQNHDARFENL